MSRVAGAAKANEMPRLIRTKNKDVYDIAINCIKKIINDTRQVKFFFCTGRREGIYRVPFCVTTYN